MDTVAATPGKPLRIVLWILQVLVGVSFIAIGAMKIFTPIEQMVAQGATWAANMPWLLRFIGVAELSGGLGLILPAATRIKPILTPIAAAALCVVMLLAIGVHVTGNDLAHSPPAFTFLILSAIIAWGRFKKAPIAPRG
jgi:putative oxidoreductase